MKVYETAFNSLTCKNGGNHGMKMVKLEKMGLKLDNPRVRHVWLYRSYNAHYFEIVALETKKRNIECSIVPIGVSCKILL